MSRTLVLGAAVSGRAAVRLAKRLGHEVIVYDRSAEAVADIEDVAVITGDWQRGLLDGVDLVISSPGIPLSAPPVHDSLASASDVISEMEFGWRHLDARCAAVTGTNGKTTVTAAAARMLVESGIDAAAAGNIGLALSDVADRGHEVVVIEASSFQLELVDGFHPEAAAILNIAPDHLDWHGSPDAYAAAKRKIGRRQTAEDIITYDADDPGATRAVAGLPARPIPASGVRAPAGGNGPRGDEILIGDTAYPRPQHLDTAFTLDMVVAGTIATHLGATAAGVGSVIRAFVPEEHRRTVVGSWRDVTWINDSKATNPHAAVAAAAAYPSVVLIAGGRNKGLDLAALPNVPSVRAVIGIGEAAAELAAATDPARFHGAASLEEAIGKAEKLAIAGDTVLLAPGCASFDMFDDYKERGRIFTDLVLERMSS